MLELMKTITPGRGVAENESNEEEKFMKNFLPVPDYRSVLEHDSLLILGGRGVGKTELFRALALPSGRSALVTQTKSRALLSLDKTIWLSGFGRIKQQEKRFPAPETVEQYMADASMLDWRSFWIGLVLSAMLQEKKFLKIFRISIPIDICKVLSEQPPRLSVWLPLVRDNYELIIEMLDGIDDNLIETDQWIFVTYDELDRVVPTYMELAAPIRELLALWLDRWRRWERIRPKIFLRTDLFQEEFLGFPDASKLRGHQVTLQWEQRWLYQLLVKRLANAGKPMAGYLRKISGLILTRDPVLGFLPGTEEKLYEQLMKMMVGEYMGANPRKGYTYRWIPNHLQDAGGRIAPRSFLKMFALAAEMRLAKYKDQSLADDILLLPSDLQGALIDTSEDRIRELFLEEYPWLEALKMSLQGLELLIPKKGLLKAIKNTEWSDLRNKQPPYKQPEKILEYLKWLGIVEERLDERINMPEIYLHGFKMKRRGGIKRPK